MLPTRLAPMSGANARWLAAGLSLLCLSLGSAQPTQAGFLVHVTAQRHNAEILRIVSPMARCLATWDRSSQMSKREWKQTCKRVVKNNPRLYSKPF
jgi:hypothetical protein